jgi:hypothetical protein
MVLSSCGGSKKSLEVIDVTEIKKENVFVNRDSIINKLSHDNFAQKEYITIIENILASTVSGTAGGKPQEVDVAKLQELTLRSGLDSITIKGIWDYFKYDWYKAPTSNVFKKETDSIRISLEALKHDYSSLAKENNTLIKTNKETTSKKVRYRISIKYIIVFFIIGFIASFLVFNWSKAVSWISLLKGIF